MNLYRMLIHIYVISEFVSLSFLVMISDTLEYTGGGGGGGVGDFYITNIL